MTITTIDQLNVAKALVRGYSRAKASAMNPPLTLEEVEQIAREVGYPHLATVRASIESLQAKADAEARAAIPKAEYNTARPYDPRMDTPTHRLAAVPAPQPDTIQALLAKGKASKAKRTAALAAKIDGLLDDLKARIAAEDQAERLRQRQEAEKVRLAEKARQEAEQLKAEIAAAEARVKELRAKAKGLKLKAPKAAPAAVQPASKPVAAADSTRAETLRATMRAKADTQRERLDRLGATVADVRAYATANGLPDTFRGIIPADLLDAYEAAMVGEAS